ncbi:MAG: phosphatidate cytidylyltransferase [Acidobacteriales bacterium]|nr:phosphatidate cytidylyltransferase [Terriglobales bacterium]
MQLLKRILTAVVLIPLVLLLVLRAPIPLLAGVAALVAVLTIKELLTLGEAYGIRPLRLATQALVVLLFVALASNSGSNPLPATAMFIYGVGFAAAIAPFFFLICAMRSPDQRTALPSSLLSTFAFGYVALPLAFLVQLRAQSAGAFLVLYLLLLVWIGDISAFFVGRSIGRHLMSPRISPKKTWEGATASLLASVAVGVLLFKYALPISSALLRAHLIERRDGLFALEPTALGPIILLSVAINLAAQTGDLLESLIKRGAGAKDSGALLPGHGGMLDRIDALLFAVPVLWFYSAWHILQ